METAVVTVKGKKRQTLAQMEEIELLDNLSKFRYLIQYIVLVCQSAVQCVYYCSDGNTGEETAGIRQDNCRLSSSHTVTESHGVTILGTGDICWALHQTSLLYTNIIFMFPSVSAV